MGNGAESVDEPDLDPVAAVTGLVGAEVFEGVLSGGNEQVDPAAHSAHFGMWNVGIGSGCHVLSGPWSARPSRWLR